MSGGPTMYIEVVSFSKPLRSKNLEDWLRKNVGNYVSGLAVRTTAHTRDIEIEKLALGRELQVGEIGCRESHSRLLSRFLASNHDAALVLEDDVVPASKDSIELNEAQIFTVAQKFPTVLHLGPNHGYLGTLGFHQFRKAKFFRCLFPPTGTYAYLMNRAAAKVFLENSEKNLLTADWPPSSYWKVRFYGVRDSIFTHPPISTSTILGRESSKRGFSLIKFLKLSHIGRSIVFRHRARNIGFFIEQLANKLPPRKVP